MKAHREGPYMCTYKYIVNIISCRFTTTITYHNSLHRFWAGCSTWTATLEVKLLHKVEALRDVVLHKIFLDLHKVYDDLDRSRRLVILEGYVVGPRALCLLRHYWERLKMVARTGG